VVLASGFAGFAIAWRGDVYSRAAQHSSAAKFGTLGVNFHAVRSEAAGDVATPPGGR
jgi:hypothetical protein